MARRLSILLILGAAALQAACGYNPKPATKLAAADLPAPNASEIVVVDQQDYRIGPFDALTINVYPVVDLNRDVQVDGSGNFNFPLIGTVTASAKTPQQLSDEIATRLGAKDLQSPDVSVFVKQSASQRYTVEGAVAKPGVYPIVGRTSMLQAIATAQGVDQVANPRNIVIFRVIDKKRMAALVDLPAVRAGRVEDPQIFPGDIISVPTSSSRRALRDVIGLTPLATFLTPFGL